MKNETVLYHKIRVFSIVNHFQIKFNRCLNKPFKCRGWLLRDKAQCRPGSIGAVVLGASGNDALHKIVQRLDRLELENNNLKSTINHLESEMKMKVDGRILIASLVEYVNPLQQVVIEQAGLSHFGCRFAAIFNN